MILGKDNVLRLPPPVGTSDWATFSRDSYCVDKTLLVKELIDSRSRVVLFTRPRRFVKTTALNMIREFYEGDAALFADKQIWVGGKKCDTTFWAEGIADIVKSGLAYDKDKVELCHAP